MWSQGYAARMMNYVARHGVMVSRATEVPGPLPVLVAEEVPVLEADDAPVTESVPLPG